MRGAAVADTLAEICAKKRAHIAARKAARPEPALRALAAEAPAVRPFAAALEGEGVAGRYGLIAEIKKASPSRGLIRADFDPAALARGYEAGGGTLLSGFDHAAPFPGDGRASPAASRALS